MLVPIALASALVRPAAAPKMCDNWALPSDAHWVGVSAAPRVPESRSV